MKAKFTELLTQRGRKGTNKYELVAALEKLLEIVKEHNLGPAVFCMVAFGLMSARFDAISTRAPYMDVDEWRLYVSVYILPLSHVRPNV